MLRAESISFAYSKRRPVLAGVSVAFSPGRVAAIIGPNGAGKTTLLRVLLGLARPQQGRATLDGEVVESMSAGERAARLAYVPQHPSVGFAYSTREVVALGRVASRRRASDAAADAGVVDAVLGEFGLVELADRAFTELSAGQRQRATLARAFAQLGIRAGVAVQTPIREQSAESAPSSAPGRPPPAASAWSAALGPTRVLLADEPFSAMDPRHAVRCAACVRAAAAGGVAVVVVLHDLAAVAGIADDVVVLDASGTLAAAGAVDGVLAGPLLHRVYGVDFERDAAPDGRSVFSIPWPRAQGATVSAAAAAPPPRGR